MRRSRVGLRSRRRLHSPEPVHCAGEMDEAHEGGQRFFPPQRDPAEAFEAVEEGLDQPAFGAELRIEGTGPGARRVRGKLRLRPEPVADQAPEVVRVMGGVRDDMRDARHIGDEPRRLGRIAPSPGRRRDPERQAERVDADMRLGGQAAARSADALKASPPLAPVASAWTWQTVASTKTYSKSGLSAKALKRRSRTPASAPLRNRAWTPVHLPKPGGRSRQGVAPRACQSAASRNNRVSAPLRPGKPLRPGRRCPTRAPCASVSVRLRTSAQDRLRFRS